MAKRRMFSQQITESDSFLDMPLSAQALYFHLGMSADDDGFVNNPKRIQRVVGANEDDLKLLIAKNFIIAFESGVIVIKHWKMNNYIRSDRYVETAYTEEKSTLFIKQNGAYSLTDTIGIPNGRQVGYADKDSIGKYSKVVVYDFNEELSAEEIKKLYETYQDAHELIEQVQAEVNRKRTVLKVGAYAYICGYAKNKGWATK